MNIAAHVAFTNDSATNILSAAKATGAKYAVVCDNPDLCATFAANGIFPIHRRNVGHDDDGDAHFPAAPFVKSVQDEFAAHHTKGWIYLGNELGSYTPERTAAWMLDGMAQAKISGATLVMGNWANFNPIPGYLLSDTFKPVLKAAAAGGHILGFHRGATGQYDTFDKALAAGGIGGFEQIQREYPGIRIAVTEFGATKDNRGYATWYADRYGGLCKQAYEWFGEHGVLFMAHFTLEEWNVSPGFALIDNPTLIQTFNAINQEIIMTQPTAPPTVYPVGSSPQSMTVANTGVRLRLQPGLTGAIVRQLSLSEVVTVYGSPAVALDQYSWQRVTTAKGETGWSAMIISGVNSFAPITVPPTETWTVHLDVPYVSQTDQTSTKSPDDCGIASLLMLTRFWFGKHGLSTPMLPTVDDLEAHTPLANVPPPKGLTFADVQLLATKTGFQTIYHDDLTTDSIMQFLHNGQPIFALVNYGVYNPDDSFKGAHFMVVIGFNDTAFLTHDPYHGGKNYRVTKAALTAAMLKVPGNAGSNQGIILAP